MVEQVVEVRGANQKSIESLGAVGVWGTVPPRCYNVLSFSFLIYARWLSMDNKEYLNM